MMPHATISSFNKTWQFEMNFGKNLGLVTAVHGVEILGYKPCLNEWLFYIDWDKMSLTVLFGIKKAFDKIYHKIFTKLDHNGIREEELSF